MNAIITSFAFFLAAVTAGFSQFTNVGWVYVTNNSGQATITGYEGTGGSVVVPDKLADIPVTGFGEFSPVFGYGNSNVTSVVLPASVTNIATYALYDSLALTNIGVDVANASYTSIGGVLFDKLAATLFSYPSARTGAYAIPDGVTSIAEVAFAKSAGLTGVTIPEGVTNIAESAFDGCTGLTTVTLPDSVTAIANYTFAGCTNLTIVSVGTGLASIGGPNSDPFSGCTALTAINVAPGNTVFASIDGVVFSDDESTLFYFPYAKPGDYAVPESVTNIADFAFASSTLLTSVTMSSGVQSISDYAFASCPVLTSISIGSGVTSIGNGAFSDCAGLTSLTLPTSVTSLGDFVFSGCTALTAVAIPANVATIGISAFSGCTALASIEVAPANTSYTSVAGVFFDETVTNLLAYPNAKLGPYTVPDGVTQITSGAFGSCPGLTAVVIPNSVTDIPSFAFGECTALASVTIGAWIAQDFPYSYSGFGSVFPASVSSVSIGEGVTAVGAYSFANCINLTGVFLPASVTSIGDGAFIGCAGLNTFSIPAAVTNVGYGAFAYCEDLSSVVFSGSTTIVSSGAFESCVALQSVLYKGNAPADSSWTANLATSPTVFYLPGTSGWGPNYGSLATQLFLPTAVSPSYGSATGFRFFWTGTGTIPMNVQRTTSMTGTWSVVSTNNTAGQYTDPTPPAGKAFYRAILFESEVVF